MGKHFVPKFYLNAFTVAGSIQAYDLVQARQFPTQPKSIANESDIYPEDVEEFLANEVENPAKGALSELREGVLPVDDYRKSMARYLYYMWKRVPAARARTAEILPRAAEEVRVSVYRRLEELANENPSDRPVAESRKRDVDRVVAKYIAERPPYFWQESLRPSMAGPVPDSLLSMTWRLLRCNDGQFLTCDNPFFYFKDRGLGNPNSVFTIPVSPSVVLAGDRSGDQRSSITLTPREVREINRRTIVNADRYLYFAHAEEWIPRFASRLRGSES